MSKEFLRSLDLEAIVAPQAREELNASRLAALCRTHGITRSGLISQALSFIASRQLQDGSIVDDRDILIFQEWHSVNALKAVGLWWNAFRYVDPRIVRNALGFLRFGEQLDGMLSWRMLETAAHEYCTETSSEYISALTLLGCHEAASPKAGHLRQQQLVSGAWAQVHSHIPDAFQTEASVTGFALMALAGLGLEPVRLDEALHFLAGSRRPEGHFGHNSYYYGTYYYMMFPVVAALARFGHHSAVAHARDFVLSQQRTDGSWYTVVEGFGEYSSREQHTALALRTLAHAGATIDYLAVHRALTWLLGRRETDGSWDGGSYPYLSPDTGCCRRLRATRHVFTTAQVLSALNRFVALEAPGESPG